MKTPLLATAALMIIFGSGCATTPATNDGMIPYHPKEGDTSKSDITCLTPVDRPPVPRFFPGMEFRYDPKLAGTMATIELELNIGSDGKVEEVRVLKTNPPGLEQAAVRAYERADFKPAVKDGKETPCRLRIVESFSL